MHHTNIIIKIIITTKKFHSEANVKITIIISNI